MATAIGDLKASLKKLKKQLDSIPKNLKEVELMSKIETISKLLVSIDPEKGMDQQQINHVVELSDKVIALRNDNQYRTYKIIGNLAVPPYDLWLPFKYRPIGRRRYAYRTSKERKSTNKTKKF